MPIQHVRPKTLISAEAKKLFIIYQKPFLINYRIARNFRGIKFSLIIYTYFSKVFANEFSRMELLTIIFSFNKQNSRILIFEDRTKSAKTSKILSLEYF